MSGAILARCRSCGAPIVWVTTLAGRAMPVDAEPVANGNLFIFQEPGPVVAVPTGSKSERAVEALKSGRPRYVSHFATCPQSERHRRPR